MAACDQILKRIRKRFSVPAYINVRIKTDNGEIGIISGAEGSMLKVWFAEKKKHEFCDPDKVAYLGINIK